MMPPTLPRITAITLGVRDLAMSAAFYDRLGWRRSSESVEGAVVFYPSGGAVFALFGREALAEDAGLPREVATVPVPFNGFSLARNLPDREAVDRELAKAAEAGGSIVKAAHDTFWGGYSGYFADPDGHLWEIAWNPFWPLDQDGGVVLPP